MSSKGSSQHLSSNMDVVVDYLPTRDYVADDCLCNGYPFNRAWLMIMWLIIIF